MHTHTENYVHFPFGYLLLKNSDYFALFILAFNAFF